jgi:hypothetical protein
MAGNLKKRGNPTPGEVPKNVGFGDLDAVGVIYKNEDIHDGHADVTEADTTASTLTSWITITNPTTIARFFIEGRTKLLVYVSTSAPAQITSGILTFRLENSNGSRTRDVHDVALSGFDTLSNQRSQLFQQSFPFNLALAPSYVLKLMVNASSVVDDTNSILNVKGVRTAMNVTLEDFKKHYAEWLLV